jgi:hypothetical protein
MAYCHTLTGVSRADRLSTLLLQQKTGEGEQQIILQTDSCRNQSIDDKDYIYEVCL